VQLEIIEVHMSEPKLNSGSIPTEERSNWAAWPTSHKQCFVFISNPIYKNKKI